MFPVKEFKRLRRPRGQHKLSCSKCGKDLEAHRIGKHRYCLKCHAENMKEDRSKIVVNVINLPRREERLESFKHQAHEQGFKYQVWEGIIDLAATFRGISNAHKNIVRYAKATKQKMVFIAEDDCVFLGTGAWEYYLSQIPDEFHLYLTMIYEGKIGEDNRLVKDAFTFSGLTCYCVHESFYDVFLGITDMDHIDKRIGQLADKYNFYVCPQFVAKQLNGYSDQKKKDCKYDHYLKGRKLFGVNS